MEEQSKNKENKNKDYCRKYRKKNLEKYRVDDKFRKQNARDVLKVLKPAQYEMKLKADRERKRLYRARLKLGLITPKRKLDDPPPEPQPVSSSTPEPSPSNSASSVPSETSFSNKQSKARSLSRVDKALPKSPTKKKEIIGSLLQRYALYLPERKKPGPKRTEINEVEAAWLTAFFSRGDVSYINPGRKDNVYIGKVDGKRQYAQKMYLLWTLRDLNEMINGNKYITNEDSFEVRFGKRLSFSLMYNFLKEKKEYIYNKHIPHVTCLCEICENVTLLAKGLNKSIKSDLPTNPHDIVERYSCDSSSEICMEGECILCEEMMEDLQNIDSDSNSGDVSEESDESDESEPSIKFMKWGKDEGNVVKMEMTIDEQDANEYWKEAVRKLKQHIHRKRIQAAALESDKKNLELDEILIHCDFSQSYKNQDQDEIQSAYFGHKCFSLFTACCYVRQLSSNDVLPIPITVTTEGNEHSRQTSMSCINAVFNHVQGKSLIQFKRLKIWTDGCSAQFRSRFVCFFIAHFHPELEIEWNYNEAHHGKGPMDGVGGTIKNCVFKEVKSGRLTIESPEEFAHAADRLCNVDCLYLPEDDYLDEPEGIEMSPEINGIMKIHRFTRNFNFQNVAYLEFFELSNSDDKYFRQFYRKEGDPIVCGHIVNHGTNENTCGQCYEEYLKGEDWLRCNICSFWFHETCFHMD